MCDLPSYLTIGEHVVHLLSVSPSSSTRIIKCTTKIVYPWGTKVQLQPRSRDTRIGYTSVQIVSQVWVGDMSLIKEGSIRNNKMCRVVMSS